MTLAELRRFIPWFLNARYADNAREVLEGNVEFGWMLEIDGTVAFVRAMGEQNPFTWFRGGIAHGIPRGKALALHVATQNRDLVVGRAFLATNDFAAMVTFD